VLFAQLPRNLEAAFRDVSDPKPEVRASAARDLVRHAEAARARVVTALESALSDEAPMVREAAAEGLGDLDAKEALSALLVAVEDDDQLVRQKAILTLGMLKDPRAQQRLERALRDPRPEVRYQAVMAYPRVASGREDAERAIADATRDDDAHVVHIAFRMAEELAEDGRVSKAILTRARACLSHDSPRVRAVAAIVVAASGDAAADAVLASVVDGTLKTDEPEDVAAAIDLAGERKIAAAEKSLERRAFGGLFGLVPDRFRWHARVALATMGHARAKSEILDELGARSFDRRTLAVSAAGKARLFEAKARIEAMKGHPDRAEPDAVDTALELLGAAAEAR
jgi:HEAT repeat protein